MGANDSLKQTLEHFTQLKLRKLEELNALELTIRHLRRELGEEEEGTGDTLSFTPLIENRLENKLLIGEKEPDTRPDEFFGMTQGDAAKIYLEKIGHAVSMEDLIQALSAGGCTVGGVDPKKTLYISLVRNTREFVPVKSGYLGLRKFYPNLKPGAIKKTKTRKSKKKHPKRTKIAKKKDNIVNEQEDT